MHDHDHSPILETQKIVHRYGGVLALDGISIAVPRGSFVAILGPNGAGKSTLGLILSGMLQPTKGKVVHAAYDGAIGQTMNGQSLAPHGVCLVPEGRRLFGQLSVEENLVLGGYGAGCSPAEGRQRLEAAMALMPISIRDGRRRPAATLSGGERQMLALGRALTAQPRVIIIDEPSMGLAPILVNKQYEVLAALNRNGVTIIVIEQLATHALAYADLMFVIQRGRIAYTGDAMGPAAEAALESGYLGGVAV